MTCDDTLIIYYVGSSVFRYQCRYQNPNNYTHISASPAQRSPAIDFLKQCPLVAAFRNVLNVLAKKLNLIVNEQHIININTALI